MLDFNQLVPTRWGHRNKKHLISSGFTFTKMGEEVFIPLNLLTKGSHAYIEVFCDYCLKSFHVTYKTYLKQQEKNILQKDCCVTCRPLKVEEWSLKVYGNKSKRFDNEYIINQFLKVGLQVLNVEEYVNSSTKMECICYNHPEEIIEITLNTVTTKEQGCKYCSWDHLSETRRKYGITDIEKILHKRGFTFESAKNFTNINSKIKYTCNSHPDDTLETSLANILIGGGCKKCGIEKRSGENNPSWNGGISKLKIYLRGKMTEWKKESMRNCGFKCVISGKRFDVIHHVYGFDFILTELILNLNIPLYKKINQYTDEQLSYMVEECEKLHKKYVLGACLTDELHKEFHSIYGYGKNTPEQFEEFKQIKQQQLNKKEDVAS